MLIHDKSKIIAAKFENLVIPVWKQPDKKETGYARYVIEENFTAWNGAMAKHTLFRKGGGRYDKGKFDKWLLWNMEKRKSEQFKSADLSQI